MVMERSRKLLWWILAGSSTVGLLASFIQTIERINFAKDQAKPLICNINAVFSCSNVFGAWQSSVFGFSNSLLCIVFFAITLGLALAGATGSSINRQLRLVLQFFAVFFLGFGAWYLWQSTFVIGYICLFCIFCYAAVIAMNAAWFRLNFHDVPLSETTKTKLAAHIGHGADIFVWTLWAIAIASMIIFRFW